MNMSNKGAWRGDWGFTLLELIISLTILSMVVMIIYYAFSMGVRVWSQQEEQDAQVDRREVLARLIEEDFSKCRAYTVNWEKGQTFLFAGGERTVFYVTRNGLGATSRSSYGLYFSCLYVQRDENGTSNIYLYKSPLPKERFIEETSAFQTMGEMEREGFVPDSRIRDKARLVFKNIEQPLFSYADKEFTPFSGSTDAFQEVSSGDSSSRLPKEQWMKKQLPQQVQFQCTLDGNPFMVHAGLEFPEG
jgi:prepilin-type N-terminal cleavage/methylation domain-containing protein